MNIAFYAPLKSPTHPVPSGDRRVARLLMQALRDGGHDVQLASTLRTWDGSGDAERQRRLRSISEKIAARLLRRFARAPAAGRPRLWFTYHLYHKAPDWIGPLVSAALAIPYVVAECSYAPKQERGPWSAGHAGARDAICQADVVMALNANDIAAVQALRGSPHGLYRLAPFLDAQRYEPAADRDSLRRRLAAQYRLNPARPWLLTVAMMRAGDKLASYCVLAKALRCLSDRDWQLIVTGDGESRNEVEHAFAFATDRVTFTGQLSHEEIAPLRQAADLFAWPAVNEAFGMALLEAQAQGLPVVAGNAGGVAGIVDDKHTGLLCPEGDAGAFADALRTLLGDAGRRARMGVEARLKVEREHDVERASAHLNRILGELMQSRAEVLKCS